MQAAGLAGVTAAFFAFHLSSSQALAIVAAVMFVVVGDQVCLRVALLQVSTTIILCLEDCMLDSLQSICALLCL